MIASGTITVWDESEGVGFVSNPEHIPNDIEPILDEDFLVRDLDLQVGDEIEYELGKGSKGWIVVEVLSIESETV